MIEDGQLPPEEVLALLAAEQRLWLRIAAVAVNEEWHETHLEITSGVAPPRWSARRWAYDDALFWSFETDGPTVAGWLQGGEIARDDVTIKLPVVPNGQRVQWRRLASKQQWSSQTLDWPTKSYQLAPQPLAQGRGAGSLIGNGPSFVRFAEAVASFFGFTLGPGGSVDHLALTLQRQDMSGRISKVRLASAEIEVLLEGQHLDGATVELASSMPGPSKSLPADSPQTVRFPLPQGVPPGAWVVLKRGSEWIDRKFINYPNTLNPDPGVEIAVEPMTEVMTLVTGGEGATVEFKGIIPGQKALREKVCRTIAAFANESGGHILFGVEDDGSVVGVNVTDAQEARDTVTRFISSIVTPVPEFRIEYVNVDNDEGTSSLVLLLTVNQGPQPPYGVNPANPRYYIRRGATTFPASADQVRALARSRPLSDSPYGGRFGILGL
ncbi:MAG: ATP-binding protein [Actinomycetota bacterium]|nr:ATP-binding protein [Actinomycetota bacterium]